MNNKASLIEEGGQALWSTILELWMELRNRPVKKRIYCWKGKLWNWLYLTDILYRRQKEHLSVENVAEASLMHGNMQHIRVYDGGAASKCDTNLHPLPLRFFSGVRAPGPSWLVSLYPYANPAHPDDVIEDVAKLFLKCDEGWTVTWPSCCEL